MTLEVRESNSRAIALYEKLGNAVYTMVKSDFNNKELMDSLIEEIDSLKAKIDEVNLQIAERKNIRICPACGSRNEKDASYCSKCGNKFGPAPAAEKKRLRKSLRRNRLRNRRKLSVKRPLLRNKPRRTGI